MSKFPDKAEKLAKAKELRLQGRSYPQIAEILGISWRTVMGWFNRHQGARDARRAKKERAGKDIYYRVRLRLQVSKSSAKAKGYLPCTTAISTIVAAYTGTCKICDSADGATKKPLVIAITVTLQALFEAGFVINVMSCSVTLMIIQIR